MPLSKLLAKRAAASAAATRCRARALLPSSPAPLEMQIQSCVLCALTSLAATRTHSHACTRTQETRGENLLAARDFRIKADAAHGMGNSKATRGVAVCAAQRGHA
jgi:hypothetical protein